MNDERSPLTITAQPRTDGRVSVTTQPLSDEIDRCKTEAAKASGEANAALLVHDLVEAERHFARASRLLLMAMSQMTAIRLLSEARPS